MLFDQNIKRPSHEKVVLSDGTTAYVDPLNKDRIRLSVPMYQSMDDNDAIRLAAFLSRWFREQNRSIVEAEKARVASSRAAKQARYEQRKAVES